MKLILKDDIPVYLQPRQLGVLERREVSEIINTWLEEKIIRLSEDSDYASPIILVWKKNGLSTLHRLPIVKQEDS